MENSIYFNHYGTTTLFKSVYDERWNIVQKNEKFKLKPPLIFASKRWTKVASSLVIGMGAVQNTDRKQFY